MKRIAATFALLLAATVTATATAGYLTGDPRKCAVGDKTLCAKTAAVMTLRAYEAKQAYGTANPARWDADITCTHTTTLLRWSCSWKNPAGDGTAKVTFRATSTGWKRIVTG